MDWPQASLGSFKRTPFVGREDERTAINRLIDHLAGGQGGIVLISGDPGVGKTRLAEEMAAQAREKGCNTFTGHCYETEGTLPYIPFVEIVEAISRALPLDALRSLLGDAAPEVAKLAPDIRRLLPDVPSPVQVAPAQERHLLFNRISEFIDRLSKERPLLLVFEDLHWADSATLFLLQHLAPRIQPLPLLVLGTYREVELDSSRPFAKTLEDLTRRRLAGRLALKPLARADVQAMLRLISGQDPPTPSQTPFMARLKGIRFSLRRCSGTSPKKEGYSIRAVFGGPTLNSMKRMCRKAFALCSDAGWSD